ncbi:uncharacterized protein DC041_0004801 [Schistosoma bovis]|uniref:SLC41A/MgtE integral membrane domain-containing protein n=1 Tax=Schistosoma bovis TaxID=6184 RepID=A0A430Q280_SCHBO|nr:uncharacterized protein DC041_0004801 [Schistosoma bovis]
MFFSDPILFIVKPKLVYQLTRITIFRQIIVNSHGECLASEVHSVYTPWPKSEEFSKCSHCLNTYFTMSSSRHIYYVAREMFPACLLAGVGMGTLTSKEESIFEIIPPILGLKGNLEVALSSRLATVVCLTLCVVVYAIVCACVFCGANPDNVAPPAAAALGDLVTVLIISHVNYYFIVRKFFICIYFIQLIYSYSLLNAIVYTRHLNSL